MIRYAALAVLLSGCAANPFSSVNQGMSADQIKAAVADKNASVVCSQIPTPWGPVNTTVVNLDQRVIDQGGISVGEKCAIEVVSSNTVSPRAGRAPLPVTCSTLAYERAIDGTCAEIRKGATCLVNSTTRVDPSKCPAP